MEQEPSQDKPFNEIIPEELTQFKDSFSNALQDILDFFPGDDFLVLQPLLLNMEDDIRSLEELSTEEQLAMGEIVAEELEVDFTKDGSILTTYEFEGPLKEDNTRSVARVSVFPTNRKELFLHKVIYENGDTVIAVGPKDTQFQ